MKKKTGQVHRHMPSDRNRRFSHNVFFGDVVDAQRSHGADQRLDGGDDVLEDQAGEALPVGVAVALAVDDPHLLDEGALAALAGPWMRRDERD